MPKYLYWIKASDKTGYVEAGSPTEARDKLAVGGLAGATIMDDETTAALRAAGEKVAGDVFNGDARLHLALLTQPSSSTVMAQAIRTQWAWLAILAGAAAYCWARGELVTGWSIIALAIACVAFPVWFAWQQYEIYRRFWANDWEGSERIARRLRRVWFVRMLPAGQMELDARVACALVKKGRFGEALSVLEPWKSRADIPAAVINSKIGALYFLNRDWPRFLESTERALELSGGSDTAKIDIAQALARMGDDDGRALSLLDEVDLEGKRGLARGFALWGRGVLALRRGDDSEAALTLARAVDAMLEEARNPITWGSLSLMTAYLAVATARVGRRDAARAIFANVKSIARWHGEDRLIDALRAEGLLEG